MGWDGPRGVRTWLKLRQGLSEYWMLVPQWEWTADGNIEDSLPAGPLSPREKAKLYKGKEGTMATPTGGKPGLPCSTFRTEPMGLPGSLLKLV